MGNMKMDGFSHVQLGTPASGGHDQESPTADWVRAVAIIAAKNKPAVLESKPQLPEDFLGTDFDVVRARALSSQI